MAAHCYDTSTVHQVVQNQKLPFRCMVCNIHGMTMVLSKQIHDDDDGVIMSTLEDYAECAVVAQTS